MVSQPLAEVDDDLPVGAALVRRLHGLAHALHAALGVGEGAVLLRVAGGGQEHVRVLARLGHEDVLHDQEVQALQRLAHVVGVRVGERRVLAHDVHGLELAEHGHVEHLRYAQAHLLGHGHAVGLGEARPRVRVVHAGIAGQRVGQRAHVAGALHVVLAAQRVDAGVGHADVAGDHGEVGQVHDVGRADGVFRDAQRVEDAGLGRGGVQLGRLHDEVLGHAGDLGGARRPGSPSPWPTGRRSPRSAPPCRPCPASRS